MPIRLLDGYHSDILKGLRAKHRPPAGPNSWVRKRFFSETVGVRPLNSLDFQANWRACAHRSEKDLRFYNALDFHKSLLLLSRRVQCI